MSENKKDIHCKNIYNEGALRILEAIGAADEELLERCSKVPESGEGTGKVAELSRYGKRRKPLWKMGRAWAACLGFLAVGFISWNGLRLIAPKGTSDSAGNASGGGMNQNQSLSAEDSAERAMYEESTEAFADTVGEAFSGETEGYDEAEVSDDLGSDGTIDRGAQSESAQDLKTQEAQKESDTFVDSEVGGANARTITEEEARGWTPLGAYIPQNLPKGYRMENAYIDHEGQSVTMTWSRGMDYIMISVSSVEPGTVETVDITKPETYDERLYEIPYAETVPKEYRESVDNPVFDFSDMDFETGLELMNSRLISYNDSGDTGTPRGRFSILIEDEILLYFNGRGTPEEIWSMLYSMKR